MHNSFSDMPFISPERYSNIEMNAERALTITNAYILAFFDRYLRGRRQPLLKRNTTLFPEVMLQIYRPKKHLSGALNERDERVLAARRV